MKRVKVSTLIPYLIIFSLLLFVLLNGADAGTVEPALQKAMQSISQNAELPVIIHLSDKVETSLIKDKDKGMRRLKIIRALKEKADITQTYLDTFLKNKNAKRIKKIWIINAIAVSCLQIYFRK